MVPLTVVPVVLMAFAVEIVLFDSVSEIVGPTGVTTVAEAAAAVASTMPVPHCEQVPGKARAVLFSLASMSSGVSALLRASISAATPATCGVAIEVPW